MVLGGDTVISGSQTFGAHHPPKVTGPGKVEVITWASFHFALNGEDVLDFLRTAIAGTGQIVNDLSAM